VSSPYSGRVPLFSFYGGLLLHQFGQLLRLACTYPGDVIFNSFYVGLICDFGMRYKDHFKEITELKLNTDCSISGSKVIDILDCAMDDEGLTGVRQEEVTVNKKDCNIRAH
jgi:hypothetical protein